MIYLCILDKGEGFTVQHCLFILQINKRLKDLLKYRKTNYYQLFSSVIPRFFFLFLDSILFMGKVTNPGTQKMKRRDLDSL